MRSEGVRAGVRSGGVKMSWWSEGVRSEAVGSEGVGSGVYRCVGGVRV